MAKRPNMTLAVKRLIRDLARRVPVLSHVRASRVLVVAGEARRASRATIRPAHFKETRRRGSAGDGRTKPLIRVNGRKILYVITLRPLWFRSTPEERIGTILHELYHASTRFDGTLHRARRHEAMPRSSYNAKIRRLLDRYAADADPELLAPFAHEGLARARMWLERPSGFLRDGGPQARRVYTEKQLFLGVVEMRAPPPRPKARSAPAKR